MTCYDKYLNEVNFPKNDMIFVGEGIYGSVYRHEANSTSCVKFIRNDEGRLNKDLFAALSSINSDYLYKLLNFYYKSKSYDSTLIGYEMKYYEPTKENILYLPIDYILDNFNELLKLGDILAKNQIEFFDIHNGNFICTDDKIVLIDADEYMLHNDWSDQIYDMVKYNNCYEMRFLMYQLLDSAIDEYLDDDDNPNLINNRNQLRMLFTMVKSHNSDDIVKVLKPHNRTIDFLTNKI